MAGLNIVSWSIDRRNRPSFSQSVINGTIYITTFLLLFYGRVSFLDNVSESISEKKDCRFQNISVKLSVHSPFWKPFKDHQVCFIKLSDWVTRTETEQIWTEAEFREDWCCRHSWKSGYVWNSDGFHLSRCYEGQEFHFQSGAEENSLFCNLWLSREDLFGLQSTFNWIILVTLWNYMGLNKYFVSIVSYDLIFFNPKIYIF